MSAFSIELQADNQVKLAGELTRYNLTEDWWQRQGKNLRGQLKNGQPITMDLQQLTRSDSAGLAWLINLVRDSKTQGFDVFFKNIPEDLNNLAKISDASPLLPLQ